MPSYNRRRPQTITAPKEVHDGHTEDYDDHKQWFLADRTNGHVYAAMLRPCGVSLFVCRL